MPQKVTVYLDDEMYQEILKMMANKSRTLSYIVNELTKQAIREKKRKQKLSQNEPR